VSQSRIFYEGAGSTTSLASDVVNPTRIGAHRPSAPSEVVDQKGQSGSIVPYNRREA